MALIRGQGGGGSIQGAREVQFATEGDVTVGRVVDRVVDARAGFVAERERVAVKVPTEDGGFAVLVREQVRAARIMVIS